MVASPLTGVEWEDHGHSHTRLSDNNRFITKRVGGNIQRRDNTGTLVPSRASRTHTCSRIKGRNVCSDGLCQGSVESTHTSQGGQSSHHGSDKQNGGGGVRSHRLFTITKEFWEFCLSRGITIIAEHLPGVLNQIADKESRCFMDKSCWMLNKVIFSQIEMIWGNMEVDLFADRLTSQKKSYVSWKPDPGAIATDAFTLSWSSLNGYAFPPFCLISLCMSHHCD